MAKVYVASSWRNKYQPEVVAALRKAGHEVYDFRNPKDNPGGFHWADVDENWQEWQPEEYIRNLTHPVAEKGFKADLNAMLWADTCVLVLPCGRSSHTEVGWFAGKGLRTIVYMPEKQEPELMYKLFDSVVGNLDDLVRCLCYDGEIQEEKTQRDYIKTGLDPWVGENPRILILGTMAGDSSINAQAYYDDPRNPFWKLMKDIFQPSTEDLSRGRKAFITGRGIALWDCIAKGVRYDSSDASFSERTLQGNNIQAFLEENPSIHTIVLNGTSTTVKYFDKYCPINAPVKVIALPSTVSMIPYASKLHEWSALKGMV